jgi:hypothetical protein
VTLDAYRNDSAVQEKAMPASVRLPVYPLIKRRVPIDLSDSI